MFLLHNKKIHTLILTNLMSSSSRPEVKVRYISSQSTSSCVLLYVSVIVLYGDDSPLWLPFKTCSGRNLILFSRVLMQMPFASVFCRHCRCSDKTLSKSMEVKEDSLFSLHFGEDSPPKCRASNTISNVFSSFDRSQSHTI